MRSLHLKAVSFSYHDRNASTVALQSVSCELSSESPVYLCGPSGSGKSTFGMLCSRLLKPHSGEIIDHPSPLNPDQRAFVFQFPENLFFEDTVGLERTRISPHCTDHDVTHLFARFGLDFNRVAQIAPYRLSAAEGRLAAIAMQLARDPRLLVLDEPTLGLDPWHCRRFLTVMRSICDSERLLLMITHDMNLLHDLPGRVLIMDRGSIVWDGPSERLLDDRLLLKKYQLQM